MKRLACWLRDHDYERVKGPLYIDLDLAGWVRRCRRCGHRKITTQRGYWKS